ncbi:hypothetical protein AGMMS49983_15560 [Clostridia bacterium]|nr:hypothetical protein AGMMS49983_15560 [Clostridia bacterium]
MIYLSKSKYCQGKQCAKILWMNQNKKDLFDSSVLNEARLETGNQVGDLAMGYYGDFVEVKFGERRSDMLADTKKYLDAGDKVIAEASFAFGENFCSVDILRVNDDGSFDVVEVKSSTSKNAEDDSDEKNVKEVYLDDMAYQYYVLTACGYRVNSMSLMQLNRSYVRHGELDIHKLFVVEDYTEAVRSRQADVPETLARITAVAEQEAEPPSDDYIGNRCNKPYECGYKAFCWRNMPENNVFDIGFRVRGTKKEELFRAGILTMEDVLNADGCGLSDKPLRQITTKVLGLPPFVDRDGIKEFLDSLWYPLYYFDFETWPQAIPLFDDVWPYEQIPTQYSLHIQNEPGGPLIHKEFLGKEGEDPRRAIAERICEDIPAAGCMIAYYAAFEKTRIKELAGLFPDLSAHLMAIYENTRDLIDPFAKGHYYCEAMGGRTSIKVVLPAFFPDDPELDYHALDLIHNGTEAADAFATLHEQSPEDIEKIRAALLKYCELDTLAMVRILDKLRTLI